MKSPVLQIRDLSIGFREKKFIDVISKSISFDLFEGQLICVVGPNGAGKSTLLRTITGLQKPLSGQIFINQEDLQKQSPSSLAKKLSVVLTEKVDISNLTVYDVVSLGRHPFTNWLGKLTQEDHHKVINALKLTNSLELSDKDVSHLSDGERQKVMISRALAQDPTILILDEPTAFLDFPHRVEIMRTLKGLALDNNYSIILSTHDLNLAITTADALLMIDTNGKVEYGAPEDLILQGLFEQTFNPNKTLIFNPFDATFHFNSNTGRNFHVTSTDELAQHWTEKALQRIGFRTRNTPCENNVRYTHSPTPTWQCTFNAQTSTHHSILDLVNFLRNNFQ